MDKVTMDQNTPGSIDKRNWRERLGIGAKDLPRVSAEFKPAPPSAKPAGPVLRPAPMAPRVASKGASATGAGQAPAAGSENLVAKLKSQRDAAEKLAEQRVQAARQRAEASFGRVAPPASSAGATRPKFSFADEDVKVVKGPGPSQTSTAAPVSQGAARPSNLPPPAPVGYNPQLAPPRQPLGSTPPVLKRSEEPASYAKPQNAAQPKPQTYPPNSAPQFSPPNYRPIDPATGYTPPPAFNGASRQPYSVPSRQAAAPRLQVPTRGKSSDYNFDDQQRPASRYVPPAAPGYRDSDNDDIFEQPAPVRVPRRATANDYHQAYREVEQGYDDESPRSRVPWILAMLLALVVAGFGSIWAYGNYIKPQLSGNGTSQSIPVVKAPDTPNKILPDATSSGKVPASGDTAEPTKKQIYDRIIGDREILGGQIVPTEVAPVQPSTNSQSVPVPAADPPSGTGTDGVPLPLPPPPGTGTQGTLEPSGKGDQQMATIIPAASGSSAADSSSAVPVPGETPKSTALVSSASAPSANKPTQVASSGNDEIIQDTPEADPSLEKKPKAIIVKKPSVLKAEKSLGAKPVMLVPPSTPDAIDQSTDTIASASTTSGSSGGLYGDSPDSDASTGVPSTAKIATAKIVEPPVVKKPRTLLDLFKSSNTETASVAPLNATVQPDTSASPRTNQKFAAVTPPPVVESSTGAFVAQLASFKTKAEASQEYARMRTKHGEIVGRYAPIVNEAQVAGTTRYRLAVGPMATADVAQNLCQSLIAAGERDCMVKRQ